MFSIQGLNFSAALNYRSQGVDHKADVQRIDEKTLTIAQNELSFGDRYDILCLNEPYGKDRLFGRLATYGRTALWYGSLAFNTAAIAFAIFYPPLGLAMRIMIPVAAALLQLLITITLSPNPNYTFRIGGGPTVREATTFIDRLQGTASREEFAEQLLNYDSDFYEGAKVSSFTYSRDCGTNGTIGTLWRYGMMDQNLLEKVFVARTLLVKLSSQCFLARCDEGDKKGTVLRKAIFPEYDTNEAVTAYQKRMYYKVKEEMVKLLPEDQKERNKLLHLWTFAKLWKAPDRYSPGFRNSDKKDNSAVTDTPGTLNMERFQPSDGLRY